MPSDVPLTSLLASPPAPHAGKAVLERVKMTKKDSKTIISTLRYLLPALADNTWAHDELLHLADATIVLLELLCLTKVHT